MNNKIAYQDFKEGRIKQNFSQQYIADEIGISRQAISQFENGLSTLSVNTIKKIQILFGVDISALTNDFLFEKSLKIIKVFIILISSSLMLVLSLIFCFLSLK